MHVDDLRAGYSAPRVCELAGITYRQLDYWTRIGLIAPSVAVSNGSGTRRRFSARDVKVVAALGMVEPRQRPLVADALRTNTDCHRLAVDNQRGVVYCITTDGDLIAAVTEASMISLVDLDTILPDLDDA